MTDVLETAKWKIEIEDSLNFTFATHVMDELGTIVNGTTNWTDVKPEHVEAHFWTALRRVNESEILDEWKGYAEFLLRCHDVPKERHEDCVTNVSDNLRLRRQCEPGDWERYLYSISPPSCSFEMARTKTTKRSQTSVDDLLARFNRKRKASEPLSTEYTQNDYPSTSCAKRRMPDKPDVIVIEDSDDEYKSSNELQDRTNYGRNLSDDEKESIQGFSPSSPPHEDYDSIDDQFFAQQEPIIDLNGSSDDDGENSILSSAPSSPQYTATLIGDLDETVFYGEDTVFYGEPQPEMSNNTNSDPVSDQESAKIRQAYQDGYETGYRAARDQCGCRI